MRKRNIGRVSAFVIIINILLVATFLADKHDATYNTTNGVIETAVNIYVDEDVTDTYIQIFEHEVAAKGYSKEQLETIMSYQWYFTSDTNETDTYRIENDKVTVCAADTSFQTNLNNVLDAITGRES